MATLNTLRTRGGVIVAVVIGIALLSFVLGDIFSSGGSILSNRKMKVGEINGHTVDYMEFLNKSELYNVVIESMYGTNGLNAEQHDAVRDMAWESFVMEYSYRPGFRKLGLLPSKSEQRDMIGGVYLSPVMSGTFVNPETGMFDPNFMASYVENMDADPTGRSRVMWNYLEDQMNDQRTMSKFITLVSKGIYVNDLEVNTALYAANNSFDARIVSQPYSAVADSTVNVTNAEIKEYYNENKKMFAQEASRDIEYVIFDLYPSEDDYVQAKEYIDQIAGEFALSDNPMQYASVNSHVSPNNRYLGENEIEGAIAAAIFNNPEGMYGPVLSADTYTIAREGDVRIAPDSLGAKHILLPLGESALADSLVRVLRSGSDFETLAREFSVEEAAQFTGGDLGRFAYDDMVPQFSEGLAKASRGDIFTVDTRFGTHVVELTYKSAPVRKVQVATIRYKVEPSSFTQQNAYSDASAFMAGAAGSYDNFNRTATEMSLSKRVARIRNTDRSVSGVDDSRELVRWAFNAKRGAVSDIMEVGGNYVIATLTDAREQGTQTLEQASSAIRNTLVRQKQGEILAERMQGASVDAIASSLGAEVVESDAIQFATFYVNGIGVEPALAGAVASGIQQGTVSRPVKGVSGVYVFEVTESRESGSADQRSERVRQEASVTSYLAERLAQALHEETDIKDNRVKFF